jgi:COP9 signalosome complex subunit 5
MQGGDAKDPSYQLYSFDESKVEFIRSQKAWMADPKYFKRVLLSPSATIKMMYHGQSGVDKGIAKGGKPIEVMGMLLGRPDTQDPHCIIITDAQPLPIEGFETRVVADDESVLNYMIELGESNEATRLERFCGWYHTHPFDIDTGIANNCFLSGTDISTQLQWQRSEDPHGNPWLAIVIDPLRSLAKGKPELAAFRVYPPDYSAPSNETPDGMIVSNDKIRVERWGVAWNRYYQLETRFFLSTLAQSTLSLLKNKFLWQSTLSSQLTGEKGTVQNNSIYALLHYDRFTILSTLDASESKDEQISGISKSLTDYQAAYASNHSGSIPMFRPLGQIDALSEKKDDLNKAYQVQPLKRH